MKARTSLSKALAALAEFFEPREAAVAAGSVRDADLAAASRLRAVEEVISGIDKLSADHSAWFYALLTSDAFVFLGFIDEHNEK